MASIAKFIMDEANALALADAFDNEDQLSFLPVSLAEIDSKQWQVVVYLSENGQKAETTALRRVASALFGKSAPKCSVEALPDTDWVAKSLEGLPPVHAGRFLVHGGHERRARRPNTIGIEIEAGQAFGTGHHGTTAGCLLAIDRLTQSRPIVNALDIGTGSGVLAIAIAKAAKTRVLASDIDPVATAVARENIHANGVAAYVRAVTAANLDKHVFRASAPYDLIVANILAGPLIALAPAICRNLAPGGSLILSGLLPSQRARIVASYRGQGLALERSSVLNDWLTLVFTRPTGQ